VVEDLSNFEKLTGMCRLWKKYNPSNERLFVKNLEENYDFVRALKHEYIDKEEAYMHDDNLAQDEMAGLNRTVTDIKKMIGEIEIDKYLKSDILRKIRRILIVKDKLKHYGDLLELLRRVENLNKIAGEDYLKDLEKKEFGLAKLCEKAEKALELADEIKNRILKKNVR